jgi:hypothetical protein
MSAVLKHLALAAFILAAACANRPQVIESGVAPISLEKMQVGRISTNESVIFPAGMYLPDFKTDEGTFYRSPSALLHTAPNRGTNAPLAGGLFLPFPGKPDQRQGAWFENRDNSWLGSPEKVWRLQNNIELRSGPMGR